ncbi:4812_t:CDS:1, partial [Funneliformis mosseae]
YENEKSLIKSAVVSFEEFRNFEDLLKAALHLKELLFEEMLIKINFQYNNSSVWHPILSGLDKNLEVYSQLKAQHVCFIIDSIINNPDELSDKRISAFDLMMVQQHLKKLLPPYNTNFV